MTKFSLCALSMLIIYFASSINFTDSVCVLESDFGFALNCNFKKAGLFRVRNLGGLKAHFGLGFSLGDELGFPESLGNVEGSKKRSLNLKTGGNDIGVLPAEKMPVYANINPAYYPARPTAYPSPTYKMQTQIPRLIMSIPQPFKKRSQMTEAMSLPLGVPPFRGIPMDTLKVKDNILDTPAANQQINRKHYEVSNKIQQPKGVNDVSSEVTPLPKFQTMSIVNSNQNLPHVDLKGHTVEELAAAANVSVEVIQAAIRMRQQQMLLEQNSGTQVIKDKLYQSTTQKQTTVTETPTTKTTPAVTQNTIPSKIKASKRPLSSGHKVMNSPKEYYPVGYDKNFDDNFKSKVDLPATSFHCGDQKHFPGLYADENLGCMVFHVCALTDEGLIMKSFLCPESTLFDQTILKCNWWFYTDCKNSKSLYDSNLPVSKSYQLMKSLSFFTKNYKHASNGTDEIVGNGIEEELSKISTFNLNEKP